METNKFYITNKFNLSDGRFILAVANITTKDIESTDHWELMVENILFGEIQIVRELKMKNQHKRTNEKALEVIGELANIDLYSNYDVYIRPSHFVHDSTQI